MLSILKSNGYRPLELTSLNFDPLKMCSTVSKKPRIAENTLRAELLNENVISSIKKGWNSCSEYNSNSVEIITKPFPTCLVHNFIQSTELLKSVCKEVKNVNFNPKNNDLYQFQQSDDVRNLTNFTFIPELYDLLRTDGLDWVGKCFGNMKLNQEISATFSLYKYKDRLLCHDDKCEDRHIAFILYLVEDWDEEDGGALQLFSSDANSYPHEVVKSINPKFNTLVLFEVTHQSFHQVAEVMSKTKERLSINGWFHSSEKKLSKSDFKILGNEPNFGNEKKFDLKNHFLFTYLDNVNKIDIKEMFLSESEIELKEFLIPKFWEEVENDIKSTRIKWSYKGPANIRKYEIADATTLPGSLKKLKDIFESKCWFKYLKSITGLDFIPSENSNLEIWQKGFAPHCNVEIQRWTHSCYTLIHDKDPEFYSKALDVILRIPFDREKNNSLENDDVPEAGHVIYIDGESKDEECLLHIGYNMNSLALVFRDTETLRFTKYLDATAKPFYQIFCTYRPWKPPADQPGLKHCEEDSDSEEEDILSEEPDSDAENILQGDGSSQ